MLKIYSNKKYKKYINKKNCKLRINDNYNLNEHIYSFSFVYINFHYDI